MTSVSDQDDGREFSAPAPSAPTRAEWKGPLSQIAHLLDALQCGALLVDRSGRTVHVNQRLCQMMQRAADDLEGRTPFDLYRPIAASHFAGVSL